MHFTKNWDHKIFKMKYSIGFKWLRNQKTKHDVAYNYKFECTYGCSSDHRPDN